MTKFVIFCTISTENSKVLHASRNFLKFNTTRTNFSFKTAYLSAISAQKVQILRRVLCAFFTFFPPKIYVQCCQPHSYIKELGYFLPCFTSKTMGLPEIGLLETHIFLGGACDVVWQILSWQHCQQPCMYGIQEHWGREDGLRCNENIHVLSEISMGIDTLP